MKALIFIFLSLPVSVSWSESGVTGGGFSTGNAVVALSSNYFPQQENSELPQTVYLPFDHIKSLRMNNGDIWRIEDFSSSKFRESNLYNPLLNQQIFYDKNNFSELPGGIEEGGYIHNSSDIIRDYQVFLNKYITGEIDVNRLDDFRENGNIYGLYINSQKERMDEEKLKILFQYWDTDINTPLQITRYQYDPNIDLKNAGNLRWEIVQEDIATAVNMATNEQLDGMENVNPWGYKYGDKVYFNPYNEKISEILLKDNTYFDMIDVKGFMKEQQTPSMIDLSKHEVESIVLQNGREIFIDDFDSLKKIKFKPPHSLE